MNDQGFVKDFRGSLSNIPKIFSSVLGHLNSQKDERLNR